MKIHSLRLACLCLAPGCLLSACTGGEEIERVEARNVSMMNSPALSAYPSGASTVASADKFCYWNDKKYSDGSSVCDSRIRYKCWGDKWVEVGQCKS